MSRVAIIQARMSSSRFPGKVLQELGGLPLIVFMARRARLAQRVDRLLVATSTDASDDPLAAALAQHGVECFRGSLADVLDRYCQAARAANARYIVRLTGDCPLVEPELVDAVLAQLESGGLDYASNVDPPTFPDGLDVEAFTMEALERAWREAKLPAEREHVTTWLRTDPGVRRANITESPDRSSLRWTVDFPKDLDVVRALVAAAQRGGRERFDRFDLYRCA